MSPPTKKPAGKILPGNVKNFVIGTFLTGSEFGSEIEASKKDISEWGVWRGTREGLFHPHHPHTLTTLTTHTTLLTQKVKSSAKDALAEAGKHTNYSELALFDKVHIYIHVPHFHYTHIRI